MESKPLLGTDVVTQIGILVNDIEKTARAYADFLGAPMPDIILTDGQDKTEATYLGEPCMGRAKLAFFRVGPTTDIELIEPDMEPSTWRDDLNRKGEGIHHIAFVIKGMREKVALLEANGMTELQKGEYTGGRYSYVDAHGPLKVLIELLEND